VSEVSVGFALEDLVGQLELLGAHRRGPLYRDAELVLRAVAIALLEKDESAFEGRSSMLSAARKYLAAKPRRDEQDRTRAISAGKAFVAPSSRVLSTEVDAARAIATEIRRAAEAAGENRDEAQLRGRLANRAATSIRLRTEYAALRDMLPNPTFAPEIVATVERRLAAPVGTLLDAIDSGRATRIEDAALSCWAAVMRALGADKKRVDNVRSRSSRG
jgi:hypothetical protein